MTIPHLVHTKIIGYKGALSHHFSYKRLFSNRVYMAMLENIIESACLKRRYEHDLKDRKKKYKISCERLGCVFAHAFHKFDSNNNWAKNRSNLFR